MPSIAICPNADVPVDLLKNMKGFETPLEGLKYLIELYLGEARGRLDAGTRLKNVDEFVRQAKSECINEHFGD